MNNLAELELESHSGQPVARLSGELDASNADRLATPIYEFVSNHEPGLVIDLTSVGYIDSAGVRLLFDLADRLDRRQLELHVVATVDTHVSEVLDVVAIDDVARVHASLPEALEALAGSDPV
jgi:anti-anti-sigma factor